MKIWHGDKERKIRSFKAMTRSPFSFDKIAFKQAVMKVVERLQRDIPLVDHDETESDVE